jgi:hypothetical protein
VKRTLLLFVVCLSIAAYSEGQDRKASGDWDKFDRLCGRLEYTYAVPEGKHPKYSVEHRKALGRVPMELFQWEDAPCCLGLSLTESVTTKRSGSFVFAKAKPGNYFLVVHWKGNSPARAITVTGTKEDQEVCSQQGVDINEEGKLQKFMMITVD